MPSSTYPLQHFIERTVSDAMQKHKGNASKGIRTVTNHRYADDIDALVTEEQLQEALAEYRDKV